MLWLPTVLAGLLLCFELPLLLLALPLLLRAAAAAPLTARTVAIARGRRPTFAGLLLCFELPLLLLLPLLRAAAAATLTALLGGDNEVQQERAGWSQKPNLGRLLLRDSYYSIPPKTSRPSVPARRPPARCAHAHAT